MLSQALAEKELLINQLTAQIQIESIARAEKSVNKS
jgi:hypothetical protein